MKWKDYKPALMAIATSAMLGGCASEFTTVAPTPPPHYSRLGAATGKDCGSLGLLATGYYFVPLGLNDRTEIAYRNAVASVPGATGLADVTVQEDWFWWVLGTAWCVTIRGEAIK